MNRLIKPNRGKQILITIILIIAAITTFVLVSIYICVVMPGTSMSGELPPLDDNLLALSKRLSDHVRVLAEEIGERNDTRMGALNRAADYIDQQFQSYGYRPGEHAYGIHPFRNITADLYGREKRNEVIIVGAHYDTIRMSPGADDNASGVAGLLEIARALSAQRFPRTLRFIAFTNEEEPFYGSDLMGSRVSARRSVERQENIVGMYALEMIGYYADEPGSQRYPSVVRHFYPTRGNFIAFVANLRSRRLLHRSISRFRRQAIFPSEGMAAPQWLVPDIRRSDHASYWQFGFPALMITDTANFRNQHYHDVGDVYRTLDYDNMARVVHGLTQMLRALAQE